MKTLNSTSADGSLDDSLDSNEEARILADILIVDDKLDNVRLLSDFLVGQQCQVRKALSGAAALTAVEALPPDLILLDINMPGIGGYEVCKRLKQDLATRHIPIIFLSAAHEIDNKATAFQLGAADYITKPFQLEEVWLRVHHQLTLQRLQRDLCDRNQQLQTLVTSLQAAQAKLVQQEKMVSISRIVAGISHEINNPLSFILGNLNPVADYGTKLVQLANCYQAELPTPSADLQQLVRDIDLEFLLADLGSMLASIRRGAERIRSVVQALHTFSHLHESGVKAIQVEENLESVLAMLHYRLETQSGAARIAVIQDHQANLPPFLGYPSLFNQVLLNLLENAVDALELKLAGSPTGDFSPTLWVSAHLQAGNRLVIRVEDNGVGVNAADQKHLFEPFFTTKEVGQGAGLGLFSSHRIIAELHQGRLSYQDRAGGGAIFTIEVPLGEN